MCFESLYFSSLKALIGSFHNCQLLIITIFFHLTCRYLPYLSKDIKYVDWKFSVLMALVAQFPRL